ncbi:DNA mismatch repair protein MutT [Anaeromicrobium sediminis]|uniref:DNA mismatch repair protein MutT n=2 Tax=Anaeromicrobium sediminis TaxID=1478221 RepID=A0A267MI36_9FIRM|nr:DNA mismatch repair protein MutT [Anaeromicrobium sediminis]
MPAAGAIIEKVADGVSHILVQERFNPKIPEEYGLIEIPAGRIRAFENIFDALRREVKEETGLTLTHIQGEDEATSYECNGYNIVNYTPFSVTQNTKGNYPIIVQVFICKAEGEPLKETDESRNARWIPIRELHQFLENEDYAFFPMNIITLKKYLKLKKDQGVLL